MGLLDVGLSNSDIQVRGLPKGNFVTNALLINDVLTTFGPPMDEADMIAH